MRRPCESFEIEINSMGCRKSSGMELESTLGNMRVWKRMVRIKEDQGQCKAPVLSQTARSMEVEEQVAMWTTVPKKGKKCRVEQGGEYEDVTEQRLSFFYLSSPEPV